MSQVHWSGTKDSALTIMGQQAWAFSNGKSTADKLKREKWRFKVLRFGKGKTLAAEKKIKQYFHVSSALEWYKKFRTHNNGSLQQAWAFSNDKSTADKLRREKWRFKVLKFGKKGILAAEKNITIFSCLKSTGVVQKVPHSQ